MPSAATVTTERELGTITKMTPLSSPSDEFMQRAIQISIDSVAAGGGPFGAVVVNDSGESELAWDDRENMLLKWWGKPGRENLRLLSDLENQHNVTVARVALDAEGKPGLVNAQLRLQ